MAGMLVTTTAATNGYEKMAIGTVESMVAGETL